MTDTLMTDFNLSLPQATEQFAWYNADTAYKKFEDYDISDLECCYYSIMTTSCYEQWRDFFTSPDRIGDINLEDDGDCVCYSLMWKLEDDKVLVFVAQRGESLVCEDFDYHCSINKTPLQYHSQNILLSPTEELVFKKIGDDEDIDNTTGACEDFPYLIKFWRDFLNN